MPGPQKTFKSSSQSKKKPKAAKGRGCGGGGAVAASPSDSDEDVKAKPVMWRMKIRVICTDPDATDSSSDEDERISPKRLVREIFIPAHCCFSSSESEDDFGELPFFGNSPKGSWMKKTVPRPPTTGCPKKGFNKKPPSLKKIRRLSHNTKSSQYTGAMQRRGGKWAAGIQESKGIRLWLGTYDSPEVAAEAYDVATRSIRGPQASTNLESSDQNSFTSSLRVAAGKSRCSDFDDVFPWGQPPYQAFPSNTSSVGMVDNGQELLPACSDFGSLMNSPSSVLENAVSDDCESPNFLAADKPSSDALSDEGPIDSVPSQQVSVAESDCYSVGRVNVAPGSFHPLIPRVKLEVVNKSTTIAPPSFLEETPYYGDFGEIFDIYGSGNSEADRTHFLDPLDDEFFSDMNFDLNTEALAWINIPEVCGYETIPSMGYEITL